MAMTRPSAPRIRVLINALHARSGGGVTYLRNILPILAGDERLELHLFIESDQIGLFHPIDEKIRVHAFPNVATPALLVAWEQVILPILGRVLGADVIFSPANFGCLLSSRNVILLRNAISVVRIEPRPGRWLYWGALGLMTFLSTLRAVKVMAVSDYAARNLTFGFWRLMGKKVEIVHHGVSKQFAPAPEVRRERFILLVSDIYVQKNFINFFRAAEIVCRRVPDIRFKVVGASIDPWYGEQVESLVESLGIGDRVEFLGRRPLDEILGFYRKCLFLAFPSTAETFGNPLVEAMACGTPIACSRTSAMPEIVGDAALFFDPFDPGSIAEACLRMIEADELREALATKGMARARQFSWERCSRQVADVLIQARAG
ncbi:MAG: glycosyltransferase family 4 protein [Alphaproteobacteria bacterium]|nr:glycosyltransferase family 4 protein [Alphaproteobacteria bacterium]